jgi:hypothetical protein
VISPEKLAANQANAQFSTGPATPEGRAKSAQNARTHGLCASDLLVANEDQGEFEAMEVKLMLDVGAKGELEQILFSELVTASWQLRRIARMETELSAGHESYTVLLDDEALQKKLDRLGRHHTRFERTFHRSLKELKMLQTSRAQKEAAPQENQGRPDLATPVKPESKISKRTHPASQHEPEEQMSAEENAELESIFQMMDEKFGPPNQKT